MAALSIWSLGHFLMWALVARFLSQDWTLFFVLSLLWEVLELYIPLELARETWSNKITDVIINVIGFYVGLYWRTKMAGLQ